LAEETLDERHRAAKALAWFRANYMKPFRLDRSPPEDSRDGEIVALKEAKPLRDGCSW